MVSTKSGQLQTAPRQHVYRAAEEILEVLFDRDQVEERAARLEIDEEVEGAALVTFAPGDRAEDRHPRRAVGSCDPQHFLLQLRAQGCGRW